MSDLDRDVLQEHISRLDNWLHNGSLDKPSGAMMESFRAAVDAMKAEQARTNLSYERPCAVLMYHINNPLALLWRDPVTLKTIKTGITAMEHRRDRLP